MYKLSDSTKCFPWQKYNEEINYDQTLSFRCKCSAWKKGGPGGKRPEGSRMKIDGHPRADTSCTENCNKNKLITAHFQSQVIFKKLNFFLNLNYVLEFFKKTIF